MPQNAKFSLAPAGPDAAARRPGGRTRGARPGADQNLPAPIFRGREKLIRENGRRSHVGRPDSVAGLAVIGAARDEK